MQMPAGPWRFHGSSWYSKFSPAKCLRTYHPASQTWAKWSASCMLLTVCMGSVVCIPPFDNASMWTAGIILASLVYQAMMTWSSFCRHRITEVKFLKACLDDLHLLHNTLVQLHARCAASDLALHVDAQMNISNKLLGAYTIEYVTEGFHFPPVPQ